ncbi:unnamed protein product [Brassica rapa subsp. narinosa]
MRQIQKTIVLRLWAWRIIMLSSSSVKALWGEFTKEDGQVNCCG